MMRRPSSVLALWALVLGALGAVFTLLGLVGAAAAVPMRDGKASDFLPFGLTFLLAGGVCLCADRRKKAARARLLEEGRPVTGRIADVRHHPLINYNIQPFTTLPGRNSPWTALCEYQWEGQTYLLRSPLIWGRPREGARVTVYLDPRRPKRAAVDPDSVPIEL